jgi:hypothetical protein
VRSWRFAAGSALATKTFRWTQHAAACVDYEGQLVNDDQLRKNIKEQSAEITKLKQSMGMNKAARDDAANSGSVSEYLENLKRRAKLFGIHRQNQHHGAGPDE